LTFSTTWLIQNLTSKEKQSTDFAEGSFSRRRLSSNTDIHDGVGETPTPELTLVQVNLTYYFKGLWNCVGHLFFASMML